MKRLCQGLLCEDLGREDVDIGSAHEVKAFDEEKKSNMESRPRKIVRQQNCSDSLTDKARVQ